MSKEQPQPKRTSRTLEVIELVVPGKTDKDPAQRYWFTTNDSPVTVDGKQYIPLSTFDQKRWFDISILEEDQ